MNTKNEVAISLDDQYRDAFAFVNAVGNEAISVLKTIKGEVAALGRDKRMALLPEFKKFADGEYYENCQEANCAFDEFSQNIAIWEKRKHSAVGFISFQICLLPPNLGEPMLLMIGYRQCEANVEDETGWPYPGSGAVELLEGFLHREDGENWESLSWSKRNWMFAVPLTRINSVADVKEKVLKPLTEMLCANKLEDIKKFKRQFERILYIPARAAR